jgi:hypothetical protein
MIPSRIRVAMFPANSRTAVRSVELIPGFIIVIRKSEQDDELQITPARLLPPTYSPSFPFEVVSFVLDQPTITGHFLNGEASEKE